MAQMTETYEIKAYVKSLGAAKVGVAPVERFEGAPRGHRPQDFLPSARSVISLCLKQVEGVIHFDDYLAESEYILPEVRGKVLHGSLYGRMG